MESYQSVLLTTNVTVSGQPPAPPAPSSSTMCTEVTESTDGQPPPQSSFTMCTQSAGGQPPPQSSQSAGGQPPPQSSSTMCTQSAGAQPPERPSPSKTGAYLQTSPEGPHIIAFVHNLSPLKRNKQNTIDYTTLTLQTDATTRLSSRKIFRVPFGRLTMTSRSPILPGWSPELIN